MRVTWSRPAHGTRAGPLRITLAGYAHLRGDRIPDAPLTAVTAAGPIQTTSREVFDGKKVVLFSVPGAFTPTCNNQHLPGYLTQHDALKAKGVATIAAWP